MVVRYVEERPPTCKGGCQENMSWLINIHLKSIKTGFLLFELLKMNLKLLSTTDLFQPASNTISMKVE